MEGLDYISVCQIVGKLYLELSFTLEKERNQVNSLYQEIDRLKNLIRNDTARAGNVSE